MSIKAISFDFWNTLFTEQPGGFEFYKARRRKLLEEALCAHGDVTAAKLEQACHIEAVEHQRIWREEHRTCATTERVGSILTQLDVCLPEVALADLAARFEEGILERPPVPIDGAIDVLTNLSGRYRLGIISDVGFSPGRVLKQVLSRYGLLKLFDSLVFSDEAGHSKPHTEVFERTCRSLSAEPATIVHIGDLEHTDVIGAKRAGYRAIRFTGVTPMDEHASTMADFVTDDLRRLPSLVETFA